MQDTETPPGADDIEDGSYYRAARRWYSDLFHMPIAERSYYIVVIVLAIINGFFAIHAFLGVFPVKQAVPFITYSNDVWEDVPHIKRIAIHGEDKNIAVRNFLLDSYVINREIYDLKRYELNYRSVWAQSTPQVFDQYKVIMDTANPYSPYRLYTNQAHRVINILARHMEGDANNGQAHIIFSASVLSNVGDQEISHSRWQADIVFKYTDFVVDQSIDRNVWLARFLGLTEKATGDSGGSRKVTPMTFVVSYYTAKELLE